MSEREELLPVCWLEPAGSRAFTVYDHDPLKPGSFPVYRQPPAPVQVTGEMVERFCASMSSGDEPVSLPTDRVTAALEAVLQAWAAEQQELTDLQAAMWQVADELKCRPTEIFDRLAKLRSLEVALQAGVPSGYALVPIKPNAAIATAIGDVLDKQDADSGAVCWYTVGEEAWRAGVKAGSLAAAPAPGEGRIAPCKACGDITVICRRLDQPNCPRKAVAQAPGERR